MPFAVTNRVGFRSAAQADERDVRKARRIQTTAAQKTAEAWRSPAANACARPGVRSPRMKLDVYCRLSWSRGLIRGLWPGRLGDQYPQRSHVRNEVLVGYAVNVLRCHRPYSIDKLSYFAPSRSDGFGFTQ